MVSLEIDAVDAKLDEILAVSMLPLRVILAALFLEDDDLVAAHLANDGGHDGRAADHGNAEEMLEADATSPHTAHTSNPVPLVVTDPAATLRDDGELSDLAPTALAYLGITKPLQMTGENLCN